MRELQELLDAAVGESPGSLLAVRAPLLGIDWQGAAGVFSRDGGRPLRTQDGFRIASMSKTFTGVLVAQLAEAGELELDAPAVDCLPAELSAGVRVKAGYEPRSVTVRHLLWHRAGFTDFALSPEWLQQVIADPGRLRAPAEIAAWALAQGEPVGAPGEAYHYSDTGYVLLGMLLEHRTGTPYWQLCRERIFDPLGMDHTWLEGHEAPRAELSHPCVTHQGVQFDALLIHGSVDWAAGGHVSTLHDIDRFLTGLFDCRLFRHSRTLDGFLAGPPAAEGFHYGMGVGRKTLNGFTLWGHLGHWGSFMYWCPEQRMTLCGTLNHDQAQHNAFIGRVLEVLAGNAPAGQGISLPGIRPPSG